MYLHDPTLPLAVTVLRGHQTLQFQVPAVSVDDRADKDISIDPIESPVPELGIFGKSVTPGLAIRTGLRSHTGIYVIATAAGNDDSGTGLAPGDVIASVNGKPVGDMQELRGAIDDLSGGRPTVLQIERNGLFVYIERELEKRPGESGALSIRH